MPEITTPQTTETAPAPAQTTPRPPVKPNGGRKKKKMVKNLIILAVVLALLAAGGFALYRFLFSTGGEEGEIFSQPAFLGSIQSKVSGSGTAKAKETAAITLNAGGTVQEVLIAPGQTVTAGQPLYTIFSQAAEDAVKTAQEKVENLYKDLSDLQEDAANLTIRAPFAGKLQDVKEFQIDQDVSKGTVVATLVNDKQLKLSLYFSYAYEDQISVGQSVDVSIPAVMRTFTGTVEKINKVSYISPEGAVHFEAVVVFDNPGTLTAGMDASAMLTAGDGTQIYPYQNGQTEFYETRTIEAKANGPVVGMGNLLDHANVEAGEALLDGLAQGGLGADDAGDAGIEGAELAPHAPQRLVIDEAEGHENGIGQHDRHGGLDHPHTDARQGHAFHLLPLLDPPQRVKKSSSRRLNASGASRLTTWAAPGSTAVSVSGQARFQSSMCRAMVPVLSRSPRHTSRGASKEKCFSGWRH